MEFGRQPLDELMVTRGLSNSDLVEAARDRHLTFKQIGKARKGRRLTRNLQGKVLEAFNRVTGRAHAMGELFNYDGDRT